VLQFSEDFLTLSI